MQAFVQELGDRLGKPVESFEQPQSAALSAQSERADMSAPMALPVSESVEQQKSAIPPEMQKGVGLIEDWIKNRIDELEAANAEGGA